MRLYLILIFYLTVNTAFSSELAEEKPKIDDTSQLPTVKVDISLPKEAILIQSTPPEIQVNPKVEIKEPEQSLGFREILLFLAFIIALGNFIYTIWNNSQEKKKVIQQKAMEEIDKFWFKEIVIPKVIAPCLTALESYHSDDNQGDLEKLIDVVGTDLVKLQVSFNTINALPIVKSPNEMKDIATSIFEELEDNLLHLLSRVTGVEEYETCSQNEKNSQPTTKSAVISEAQNKFIQFISTYRQSSFDFSVSRSNVPT